MMDKSPITPKSPRAALEPEAMPPPPRRSRSARHPFVIAGNAIITILLLLMVGGGALFVYGKQQIEAPGPLAEDKVVNIPPRSGTGDIADILQREGVIVSNRPLFFGAVIAMKARSDLKSGEYQFAKHASLRDVIDTLVDGKVVQHTFTIPEGLTSEQIIARLMENPILTGAVKEIPREGTLLPETYKVTRGTTREQVIQRMQQAQRKIVQELWERRAQDLPVRTPEQLIVLASIVEKETGRPDERSRVASVFSNRLRQRMRLQSDPTIIYGLVGGRGTLGRPIKRSEIKQPTPYNTYMIDGLPPGPIANPGRASLEATANPARTRDLFFVATGDGGHTFTETYDQHQKNVVKLRTLERRQKIDELEDDEDDPPTATPARPAAPVAAPSAAPAKPATAPASSAPPKPAATSAAPAANATAPSQSAATKQTAATRKRTPPPAAAAPAAEASAEPAPPAEPEQSSIAQ
jgi:UPF0755 protein